MEPSGPPGPALPHPVRPPRPAAGRAGRRQAARASTRFCATSRNGASMPAAAIAAGSLMRRRVASRRSLTPKTASGAMQGARGSRMWVTGVPKPSADRTEGRCAGRRGWRASAARSLSAGRSSGAGQTLGFAPRKQWRPSAPVRTARRRVKSGCDPFCWTRGRLRFGPARGRSARLPAGRPRSRGSAPARAPVRRSGRGKCRCPSAVPARPRRGRARAGSIPGPGGLRSGIASTGIDEPGRSGGRICACRRSLPIGPASVRKRIAAIRSFRVGSISVTASGCLPRRTAITWRRRGLRVRALRAMPTAEENALQNALQNALRRRSPSRGSRAGRDPACAVRDDGGTAALVHLGAMTVGPGLSEGDGRADRLAPGLGLGRDPGPGFVAVATPDDPPCVPGPHPAHEPRADSARPGPGLHHPVEHRGAVRDTIAALGADRDGLRPGDARPALAGQAGVFGHGGLAAVGADRTLRAQGEGRAGRPVAAGHGDAVGAGVLAGAFDAHPRLRPARARGLEQDRFDEGLRQVVHPAGRGHRAFGTAGRMPAPVPHPPDLRARAAIAEQVLGHLNPVRGVDAGCVPGRATEVARHPKRAPAGDVRAACRPTGGSGWSPGTRCRGRPDAAPSPNPPGRRTGSCRGPDVRQSRVVPQAAATPLPRPRLSRRRRSPARSRAFPCGATRGAPRPAWRSRRCARHDRGCRIPRPRSAGCAARARASRGARGPASIRRGRRPCALDAQRRVGPTPGGPCRRATPFDILQPNRPPAILRRPGALRPGRAAGSRGGLSAPRTPRGYFRTGQGKGVAAAVPAGQAAPAAIRATRPGRSSNRSNRAAAGMSPGADFR